MKDMMFNALKALGTWIVLSALCMSAQARPWIIVKVPFDFVVRDQHFAAGTYTVGASSAQQVIEIRSEDDGSMAFVIANSVLRSRFEHVAKLVFHRYGDQYFLFRLWAAERDDGCELWPSKAEQELASAGKRPEVVALVAVGRPHRPPR